MVGSEVEVGCKVVDAIGGNVLDVLLLGTYVEVGA